MKPKSRVGRTLYALRTALRLKFLGPFRKPIVVVVGLVVLVFGVALLVLPGPAVVFIPMGLAILAAEFAWARRWFRAGRRMAASVQKGVFGEPSAKASPVPPPGPAGDGGGPGSSRPS